jgi:hypothetical protein
LRAGNESSGCPLERRLQRTPFRDSTAAVRGATLNPPERIRADTERSHDEGSHDRSGYDCDHPSLCLGVQPAVGALDELGQRLTSVRRASVWLTIGLLFGALTERSLKASAAKASAPAAQV